jgi:putative DNA primase/helicase
LQSTQENVDAYLASNSNLNELASNNLEVIFYDQSGRIGIRHINGRLPDIVDAISQSLTDNHEYNIFIYAGRISRLYEIKTALPSITRAEGSLVIHPIDPMHLTELMGRVASHVKYDMRATDKATGKKGAWVNCDCPRRIAEAYLSRGYWPELPILNGFVEAPTIDEAGRLIDQPGYDKSSGLYLAFSNQSISGYSSLPTLITKQEASKALEELSELVGGFPYVNAADKSGIIAAIITALLRRILPSAPMFAVTAPMPGTGKTLLAETAAIISTGRRASVLSLGHDDAEAEKRLGGVLLAGDAAILLDNIERPLSGDLLCQVTTQPSVRLRPLGVSSVISVPTHSLILATGNNLSIVGDLKRRVVLIRMDAKTERPEQRPIPRDHIAYVLSKRGSIIRAALAVTLAYLQNDAPKLDSHIPFGSFELWDKLVRRPLLWLGYTDPLGGAEALRDADPDMEAMRALFNAWLDISELQNGCTVADIIKVGNDYMVGGDPSYPDMRDALQLVCSEKINSRRLGYWLRSHKDRIVDGIQLLRVGEDGHAKVARWKVIKCG